jgi:hypothetical protein
MFSIRLPRTFGLRTLLLAVLACALGILGYGLLPNEVSRSQIRQLRSGITADEVIAILGEPDSVDRNASRLGFMDDYDESWLYGDAWSVFFVNGRYSFAVERF